MSSMARFLGFSRFPALGSVLESTGSAGYSLWVWLAGPHHVVFREGISLLHRGFSIR